jgi:hypothetical protein
VFVESWEKYSFALWFKLAKRGVPLPKKEMVGRYEYP